MAGSSPRMRGTLEDYIKNGICFGIIPAHAGNTFDAWGVAICPRDHPRACGEHALDWESQDNPQGSSPRMRGTQSHMTILRVHAGIIPAHAGNTKYACELICCDWDHPRACGEHLGGLSAILFFTGSSPRMRGTRKRCPRFGPVCRIIPAHAGNTSSVASRPSSSRDHPRACGEHTSRLAQYRGFLIRSVCFLFSFILSTSLLAGIYWRCSIRDEEHRQKTLPSHWMAV